MQRSKLLRPLRALYTNAAPRRGEMRVGRPAPRDRARLRSFTSPLHGRPRLRIRAPFFTCSCFANFSRLRQSPRPTLRKRKKGGRCRPKLKKGRFRDPFRLPCADYAARKAGLGNLLSSSSCCPVLSAIPMYRTLPAIFALVTSSSPNSRPNVGSANGSLACSSHQAQ